MLREYAQHDKVLMVFVAVLLMLSRAAPVWSAKPQAATTQPLVLRIAADPNDLPFSNDKLEGFENKIAALIAQDLGATIDYTWWAQRRGFFRDTVKHGEAEIVMGVPAENFERVIPTRPYYRSTYVFVTRHDRNLRITSFDDPVLRNLRIGVTLVGGNSSTPPAQALADRGIVQNLVGYSIYSDYREPNPTAQIIRDVADGKIDVAAVWGPLGGYFARRQTVPLDVWPLASSGEASTPFAYSISVGVKRSKPELKNRIDEVLARRKPEIDRILAEYNVPRAAAAPATQPVAARGENGRGNVESGSH
jgi:mxaJ protein